MPLHSQHLKAVPDAIHFDIIPGSEKKDLKHDNVLTNADINRRNLQQQKINSLFAESAESSCILLYIEVTQSYAYVSTIIYTYRR